jgi:prepilin-type N-terminal cleavage/methylation domain-containing protein
MKKARGFTLIELIMVIVILGILAVMALPRYVNLKQQANVASIKGNLGNIRAAVAIYYASTATASETPTYPTMATMRAGGLFSDGKVPEEPVNNSRSVIGAFDGTQGWVYDSTTGNTMINLSQYSQY